MHSRARHRLRDTIKRLFAEGETTFGAIVESGALPTTTLARVISADGHNVGIDALDGLAEALQVEPWQLLHPDLDVAELSRYAILAAQKMDELPEEVRARAYALFVQQVDFGNVPTTPPPAPVAASAPGKKKPRKLRPVHR